MRNVIIDLGNYNIKYLGDSKGLFSSKYHTKLETNPEAFERVEIGGQVTYIGVGELEREYNKAVKNVIPQILYAISLATNENDINLCLLLPIAQLGNKEQLISKLIGNSFSYKVNGGAERTTRINKVAVLPEGQVSRYSMTNPSPYSLIIDIGSRTVNWIAYSDNKVDKNGTEKLGVFDLYSIIKNIENSKGEDLTEEEIETQIKRGRIQVSEDVYKDFLKDILNKIKANVNIKNYDVTFVGGGSLVLKDILTNIPNVSIHQEPLYSNVLGAYNICCSRWGSR